MKMKAWVVAAALAVAASGAQAQAPGADGLLKDAARKIVAAKRAPTPERALRLFEEARRKLQAVLEAHPTSEAAKRLATGKGIGAISMARVGNAIEEATAKCWTSASSVCVSRLTLQAAKSFDARSDWEFEIRAGAYAAGAAVQAKDGNPGDARVNFDQAVAAARSVKSGYARARVLRNVASVQAEAGDVDSARATARSIRDVHGRIDALVGVASASAKRGDLGAALKGFRIAVAAVRSIRESNLRTRGLSKVALAQAAVGYTASARATARSIRDIQGRADALVGVASALAQEGKRGEARAFFDLAVDDAGSIADGYRRAIALGKVAWAQAEAGEETAARMTLDRALEAGGRGMDVRSAGATIASLVDVDPYVFIQIAVAQMKVEDFNGARKTLDRVFQSVSEDISPSQVKWLFNIASAQTAAGDADGARRTLDAAAHRLRSANDDDLPQNLVYHIAPDQLEALLGIVASLDPGDIDAQSDLVYHVAMRQAQTGEIQRSLHHAGMIDGVPRRDAVYREIVTAQAGAKRFNAATAAARSIKDSNKRIRAFAEIAQAQAQSGDVDNAGKTVGRAAAELASSGGAGITAWTYTDLASAHVSAGRVGDARHTLRGALLELRSASTLARATWLPGILDVILKIE